MSPTKTKIRKIFGFLRTKCSKIVDGNNNTIIFTGVAIGGHLNMENLSIGYPGHETTQKGVEGFNWQRKLDFFFHKYYEYFWDVKDVGMNSDLIV